MTFHKATGTYGLHPFNPMKLLAHQRRVRDLLDGKPVFPISVELDLSLKCNHGCHWCSFDGWRQRNWVNLPTARAVTLIDELAACGVMSVTLTGGGEPLVHPQAEEVMRRLTSNGIEWGIVTNGFRLTDARADLVAQHATFARVSLDAGTPDTHQRIHATTTQEFHAILRNIKQLRHLAGPDRLTIGASFCVFDSNLDEISLAAANVKAAGGNYLEVRPVYPTEWRGGRQGDNGLSSACVAEAQHAIESARRDYDDGLFRVIGMVDRFEAVQSFRHRDFYSACRITGLSTVISADGFVYACCVHRGLEPFRGGSIFEHSFKEVWLSEQRKTMTDGIDIDKCPKCRYVGLNAVLESAFVHDGMHQNFI